MTVAAAASMPDTREEYQELFNVYWPIGVGIFAIIAVLLVFTALRFRSDEDDFPKGKTHSHAEEVYAVGVGVIAAALLFFTYNTMGDLDDLPFNQDGHGKQARAVAEAELVKVTAARWQWRFDYPKHGVTEVGSIPTLVVPQNTPVRFEQTSVDVVHSFWIPERRFKVDAFPGRTTTFTLTFPELGFQRDGGACNQYCGWLHAYMKFNVHVVTQERYRQWIRGRQEQQRQDRA